MMNEGKSRRVGGWPIENLAIEIGPQDLRKLRVQWHRPSRLQGLETTPSIWPEDDQLPIEGDIFDLQP